MSIDIDEDFIEELLNILPAWLWGFIIVGVVALLFGLIMFQYIIPLYRKSYLKTFHLTLNEERSSFSKTKQRDGKISTHIYAFFEAKNKLNEPLHINKAKILKPKIKSNYTIHINTQGSNGLFDQNSIPANSSREVVISFLIEEDLKQKDDTLKIKLAIFDSAGNEQIEEVVFKTPKN
ncbi:MAG: hypothetical protein K2Q34_07110 [Alphaproteobacteria bacterium]|nr:hypothetical protein [Alphaproteobacteria bacterium]